MMLYLVFDASGGTVEDILAFRKAKDAEEAFKKMTGVYHADYKAVADGDTDDQELIDKVLCSDGVNVEDMDAHIWTVEVQ